MVPRYTVLVYGKDGAGPDGIQELINLGDGELELTTCDGVEMGFKIADRLRDGYARGHGVHRVKKTVVWAFGEWKREANKG